jgi:hypothetical protein
LAAATAAGFFAEAGHETAALGVLANFAAACISVEAAEDTLPAPLDALTAVALKVMKTHTTINSRLFQIFRMFASKVTSSR